MLQAILFPGQGAQFRGMGRDLFGRFPSHTRRASDILGYSIEQLCVEDPENKLTRTQFTQPALYVVNALAYYERRDSGALPRVDYLAGHSLGEYNALLAADAFSFEDGLQLVKLRGQLMGEAEGGGMAAVIGIHTDELQRLLRHEELANIEVANVNTPTQVVISGATEDIAAAGRKLTGAGIRCVILNVGAAFHSRYMQRAQEVFSEHLRGHSFRDPQIPVIANLTARPYEVGRVADMLGRQIASPVLWMDSMIYLLAQAGLQYSEIGSSILTKMGDEVRRSCGAAIEQVRAGLVKSAPPQVATSSPRYFEPW